MVNLLIGSFRTSATKYIAHGNVQRFMLHKSICTDRFRNDLVTIFKKNFSSSTSQAPVQKNRYWFYLCASILSGICLQQSRALTKQKEATEEEAGLENSPAPISSISSGPYKACYYNPIPQHIVLKMKEYSYKDNCPIPITDLAYVKVTHYNMDGNICSGELVVHQKIAQMVMEIFQDIFKAKFPIEQMDLIDEYFAIDELSMRVNNSSAFCFRSITNQSGIISHHGLGLAIDINPKLNPYIKGNDVKPPNAGRYEDRSLNEPGMIQPGDAVVTAFKQRGFEWGGDWRTLKDYQHFEFNRKKIGI